MFKDGSERMKIAIVTDSTANLSKEECSELGVHVLPLSVLFEHKAYQEGVDITTAEFYEMVRQSSVFPTSSQPAIGKVYELFEELSHKFDAIISIHISSKISGTFQTVASVAKDMEENIKIYPVDTGVTSAVQSRAVRLAAHLAKQGVSPEEIARRCEAICQDTKEYFIVDSLANLYRGGRLSAGSAAIGTLLKIKPILTFEDKAIVAFEKIRTYTKAMKRVEELIAEDLEGKDTAQYHFAIVHADCPQKAKEWEETLKAYYPTAQFGIEEFSPVIGTHLGEGAIACVWSKQIQYY